MTAVKLTKILGALCIVLTFISISLPGTYTILFGLVVLLPVAFWARKKMLDEEKETTKFLDRNFAACGFRGLCYEGNDSLKNKELCDILFKGKEIVFLSGKDENSLVRSFTIEKENIISVQEINLAEVKEIAKTNLYSSLGKLGEYFFMNEKDLKKSRKDKNVNYIVIRYKNVNKKNRCLSFFERKDDKDLNRRLSLNNKINDYCKENYGG